MLPCRCPNLDDKKRSREILSFPDLHPATATAIGKFPSGAIADKFGGRRNFLGGIVGAILFTLLFMIGGGFPIFTLAWIGNRFVQSLGWAGLVKITSRWFFYSTYGSVMAMLSLSSTLPLAAHTSNWKSVLYNGELQLLAMMYFFLKLTRYSLLFWLPIYLIESQHATSRSALKLSSLFELVGFVGALLAAYISDRFLDGRRYPVGATMLFLAAFVFLLHPIISTAGTVAVGISISVIGILIFGPDVLMASTAVLEAVPPEQAGRGKWLCEWSRFSGTNAFALTHHTLYTLVWLEQHLQLIRSVLSDCSYIACEALEQQANVRRAAP